MCQLAIGSGIVSGGLGFQMPMGLGVYLMLAGLMAWYEQIHTTKR